MASDTYTLAPAISATPGWCPPRTAGTSTGGEGLRIIGHRVIDRISTAAEGLFGESGGYRRTRGPWLAMAGVAVNPDRLAKID